MGGSGSYQAFHQIYNQGQPSKGVNGGPVGILPSNKFQHEQGPSRKAHS